MPEPPSPARIPDSHKNAFWIWGVTAMVMREPIGIAARRIFESGLSDPAAQLTALRTLIALLILSRQFLDAGIFFDRVYLRPDSYEKFPHRSYPTDFITRLLELLTVVAASSLVGVQGQVSGWISPFLILTAVMLSAPAVWLGVAIVAGFSTRSGIESSARFNAAALAAGAAAGSLAAAAGLSLWWSEILALVAVAVLTAGHLGRTIVAYGRQ